MPILVLVDSEGERAEAQAAGADVFIAKPLEPDVLCAEIERLLSDG